MFWLRLINKSAKHTLFKSLFGHVNAKYHIKFYKFNHKPTNTFVLKMLSDFSENNVINYLCLDVAFIS